MHPDPDLVLASASARRRDLLERLGLVLRILPVDIDEAPRPGDTPREHAARLAAAKCDAAGARIGPEERRLPLLAADTVVVLEGESFGKPRDADQARAMLGRLAGRQHHVLTGYHLRFAEVAYCRLVTTAVTIRLIDPPELEAYVASGEWRDKAGGYAVQGIAAVFVSSIKGSITNVIGLPLAEVVADLRAAGALSRYPPPAFGAVP